VRYNNNKGVMMMKQVIAALTALVVLTGQVSISYGYSKPNTYDPGTDTIVLKEQYLKSPHGWIIAKAIDLLRHDGYVQEADEAQKNLLPMLEGVTYNDVWGDADLAGGSVLDYYIPDKPEQNFGYGCALDFPLHAFAPYKNCTQDFKNHEFYGYGNAAEHAQFRYDYALRIANGHWGDDRRDMMAGWVNDTFFGQDDPMDGRYATTVDGIDHPHHTWGDGQTAASVFFDMRFNFSNFEIVNPAETQDDLAKLFVPKKEVFDHAPEWFDDHYGDADDIEAFNGWDGHGNAVYASWTLDAGGHCTNGSDCAAPMVVRMPVESREHAFFQLGWALHLLEDVTTPVHTIDGSVDAFQMHNDVEKRADEVLASPGVVYNNHVIKDSLPALTAVDFGNLYPTGQPSCSSDAVDPMQFYKTRWYTDTLQTQPGEGVAHAYVRNSAEISHQFIPYIKCINTEDDTSWNSVGIFTLSGLDTGVKSAAGLMHQFMNESALADTTPPSVTLSTNLPNPTNHNVLTFTGSATDAGSFVKSVEYSLDDGNSWQAAQAADGAFDSQSEAYSFTTAQLADGVYTIRTRATDVSGNVSAATQPDVIVVDTTPPVISISQPMAVQYSHSSTMTLDYTVIDALSGVQSFTPTIDGSATVGGHGLATGQPIDLLTELGLGNHIFSISATDLATNGASRSVSFSIVVTADSIKDDVSQFLAHGMIKNKGEANSLTVKLNAAASSRARGDCKTAANNYNAFINELNAQRGKGVDANAAQIMIADAQYLVAHCP
jgi:hypothetical protein